MRLKVPEVTGVIIDSSTHRMEAIQKHGPPKNSQDVINILSDQTDNEYRVFQEFGPQDYVKTIAVGRYHLKKNNLHYQIFFNNKLLSGIFDCIERTWSIYTDKPNCSEPILVIQLQLNNNIINNKHIL